MKPLPTLPSGISRRHLLRQVFAYSAAAALAGRLPAFSAPAAEEGLHFLMLGDFGNSKKYRLLKPGSTPSAKDGDPNAPSMQDKVAAAMKGYVQSRNIKTEGLFLLGDNFYGTMPGGVASPRWKEGFEDMYPADVFPGPCWAMLGNHDYDEESFQKVAAQLSYADAHPGTRWTMPSKWFRVDWPEKDPLVTCLVLDSNYQNHLAYLTPEEKAKQAAWMKSELEKPRAAWTVAFGHHPLYSNGPHGDSAALIAEWGPIFQKYGVAAYFCGHDHDLQHLEFEGVNTSFVVSGGGGASITKIKTPDRKIYSEMTNGFSHLVVTKEKLIVRHLSPEQKQLHAFSRDLAGKVEILT
ncbi:MAG TPA: metallophosphoesterase [Chthoniobacter sp.]|nr:metallophosphoesterase [Chthoniobacter sp.]